jgi:hypothetical protein
MNRAAILVLLLMAEPAFGHDIYKDWKAQSGASCCSERVEHPNGHVPGEVRS